MMLFCSARDCLDLVRSEYAIALRRTGEINATTISQVSMRGTRVDNAKASIDRRKGSNNDTNLVVQASASIDQSGGRILILDLTKIYLSEHRLRCVFLRPGMHSHALSYLTTIVFMNTSRSFPPHVTQYQESEE